MHPTTPQFFPALTTRPRPPFDLNGFAGAHLNVIPGSTSKPMVDYTGYLDVRPHALYDRLSIAPYATAPEWMFFFTEPVGRYEPGTLDPRTHESTNMYRACSLPPPESFLLQRILFLFDPASDHIDAASFAESHWIEFTMGDVIYHESPLFIDSRIGSIFELFDHESPYRQDPKFPKHPWPEHYPGRRIAEVIPEVQNSFVVPDLESHQHGRYIHSMQSFKLNLRGDRPFRNRERTIQLYAILDGVGTFGVQ